MKNKLNMSIRLLKPLIAALILALPFQGVAANKPIELKYAVLESAQSARGIHGHKAWADKVNAAGNGMLKVIPFYSGSLAGARQSYDACINGIIDIVNIAVPHYAGRFPLTEALIHPGSNLDDPLLASKVAMAMYNKYPQMQKEFRQIKFLFIYGFAPISIASTSKPIRTIEDIKGMRLRVAQKSLADLLKTMDVSPMFIKPGDIFMNMQKGVIDGSVMGWAGHQAFGVIKLAKYFTVVPAFPGPFFVIGMNKAKWNSLPAEAQGAIMSQSGDAGSQHYAKAALKETEVATKSLVGNSDKETILLSQKEVDRWTEASKPIQEKMIKKLEKKKLPVRELFADVAKMVKENR